jgi:hypothetical protein
MPGSKLPGRLARLAPGLKEVGLAPSNAPPGCAMRSELSAACSGSILLIRMGTYAIIRFRQGASTACTLQRTSGVFTFARRTNH